MERRVLRPLYSRMWAVFGAVMAQREPLTQNSALHLLVVSAFGRVAASMLVFRPAVESCPCRAMSVRARWVLGARPSYICEYVREIKLQYLISISNFRLLSLVWSPNHARDERFSFPGSDLSDLSRRASPHLTAYPRLRTRLCGRRAGVRASQSSHGAIRWWESRLIHDPTA